MSVNNLPDDEREVVNILAKAGYLKASNDKLEVSLESSNTLNIQPKNNIFGAKITVGDDGSITPTLTFDTKKLNTPSKKTNPIDAIDKAIDEFWENNDV